MLPQYSPPRFPGNVELTRSQDATADALRVPLAVPLLDGVSVENIELAADKTQLVKHGLDRPIIGWLVTDRDRPGDVWRLKVEEKAPGIIALRSANNLRLNLWVY